MRRPPVASVLVALLVVLSGCAGVLDPGPHDGTTTAEPTTDSGPASRTTPDDTEQAVYALLAEGVSRPFEFAERHVDGLAGRSFTTRTVRTVRSRNGSRLARLVSTARVGPERARFVYSRNATGETALLFGPGGSRLLGGYGNGTVTFQRWLQSDGDVAYARRPSDVAVLDGREFEGVSEIARTFAQVDTELDSIVTRDGRRLFRVVSTDGPHGFDGPDVSGVRLVALVDADGVVSELRLAWTGVRDGRRVRIERRVVYEAVGETTVEAPPWLAEARNRTTPVGRDG